MQDANQLARRRESLVSIIDTSDSFMQDANQLARRNLTPDQRQILIGRRHLREKLKQGGDRKSKGNICTLKPTAEKLAGEYKVSPRTIKNHAETAKQFERLQKEKPELAKEIFQGKKTIAEAKKEERKEIQKEKRGWRRPRQSIYWRESGGFINY